MTAAPFLFPRVLAWEITRRCPLRCRHCRAGAADTPYSGELTTEECLRVIDSLAAGGSGPMIIWTGGEPMYRDDLLELVRRATAVGLRSVLAPCGLLANAPRLAELRQAGISACSFSLDGEDAVSHDSFRGVAGAWDRVTCAMRAAREIGMPFQVNVTVSRLNFHRLDAIYALALELGASKLDLFFLVPTGRGQEIADLALSPQETRETLEWAFARAKSGPLAVKETCCPSAPAYWAELGGEKSCGPRPCGCLGGRGFAFLSHSGKLQTCGFVDTPCGDIRQHGCDFRAMVSAARNPLGSSGTCRG